MIWAARRPSPNRHAVAQRLAADRRRRRRRRRGRSSPRSPAGGRAGAWPGARRRGDMCSGSRRSSVAASRRPTHSVSGSSWSKASASSAPSTSSHRRFLRPAEIWLTIVVPIAPWSVSNWTTAASSVATSRTSPSVGAGAERGAVLRVQALRQRGQHARAQPRDAVAGDELGEVAPVRADVGERARGAAELGVDAPVVVLRAQQPVLQVGAVEQADRPGGAAADALARLADRRVVAVDERHRGDLAGRRPRRRRGAARRRRRAPAASRRSRACRRPARPRRAAGAGGSGVQMWTTSTSSACTSSSELANARSTRSSARGLLGAGGRGGRDADDVGAGEAGGADVDGADEPGCRRRRDSERDSSMPAAPYATFCMYVKQKIGAD